MTKRGITSIVVVAIAAWAGCGKGDKSNGESKGSNASAASKDPDGMPTQKECVAAVQRMIDFSTASDKAGYFKDGVQGETGKAMVDNCMHHPRSAIDCIMATSDRAAMDTC